jgi:4-hydroxybenzoate polyprenyltransferase
VTGPRLLDEDGDVVRMRSDRALPTRLIRDVVALLLILAGTAALTAAAWLIDWKVGLLVTGATVAGLGVSLGMSRGG